jgi:hypothetical protein
VSLGIGASPSRSCSFRAFGQGLSGFRVQGELFARGFGVWFSHLHNVLAQDLLISNLGVPPIHHFIEKLIRHHKVVTDRLLLQLPEVVLQDSDDVVEKYKERSRITALEVFWEGGLFRKDNQAQCLTGAWRFRVREDVGSENRDTGRRNALSTAPRNSQKPWLKKTRTS